MRGLPSKNNGQPSNLLLSGDLVRAQELLWVSFRSKGASPVSARLVHEGAGF